MMHRSRITTVSDEDLWEEARRREQELWRELQASRHFRQLMNKDHIQEW